MDVRTLLVDGAEDTDRLRIEAILALGVTDVSDHSSHDRLQVDVSVRGDLSGNKYLTGSH